jgi:radical SAM superfamily enzyme YgiQ (UPF0313 family)
MAKIGMIYITEQPQIAMGLAYISAVLKKHGHEVKLWDTYYKKDDIIIDEVIKSDIQILLLSAMTLSYERVLKTNKIIKEKRPDIYTLLGGWHSVINPEQMINEPSVDMICIGEGEYAVLDIANDLDSSNLKNADKIQNIWSKKNREIIRNQPRKLGSLDDLPFPDRDIFNKNSLMDRDGRFFFSTGRGCPYACTYCCNEKMVKLYAKYNSPYVRFRSVEKCIEELKMIEEKYNPIEIYFVDEQFLISDKRTKEFCKAYKEAGIKTPFCFMARVEKLTDELGKVLKDAGCIRIHFGVESGNEELRRKYLNRHMTNDQIINAFDICKKYGIIAESFNMLGLPFETKKTIRESFELNKRLKPNFAQFTILYPFPETRIREIYKENNLLDLSKSDEGRSIYETYITKNPNLSYSYLKHQQVFLIFYFSYSKFFAYLSKLVPFRFLDKYMVMATFLFKKDKTKLLLNRIRRITGGKK